MGANCYPAINYTDQAWMHGCDNTVKLLPHTKKKNLVLCPSCVPEKVSKNKK
jgi:hypothetical protein